MDRKVRLPFRTVAQSENGCLNGSCSPSGMNGTEKTLTKKTVNPERLDHVASALLPLLPWFPRGQEHGK